jgi:hypothetical protein
MNVLLLCILIVYGNIAGTKQYNDVAERCVFILD